MVKGVARSAGSDPASAPPQQVRAILPVIFYFGVGLEWLDEFIPCEC